MQGFVQGFSQHGTAAVGRENDHKNYKKAETPSLCKQAERVGGVHPGEGKPSGRANRSFSINKKDL